MLSVVPNRKLWYTISGALFIASVIALGVWRLNVGVDFTGGVLVEYEFTGVRPSPAEIEAAVEGLGATQVKVQTAGDRQAIIRMAAASADIRPAIAVYFQGTATESRFEAIGPSVGRELARKTTIGVFLSLALITCYVAWVFRRSGQSVSVWAYGAVALVSMAHTVVIPLGVFAVLGEFQNVEMDASFIAALLTILGYSINDTIIVLDRVRENLTLQRGATFAEVVESSIRQSFRRSLNTGFATMLALLAIAIFGGASIQHFALAIALGIGIGTYSSLFIAAPLLVTWQQRRQRA